MFIFNTCPARYFVTGGKIDNQKHKRYLYFERLSPFLGEFPLEPEVLDYIWIAVLLEYVR